MQPVAACINNNFTQFIEFQNSFQSFYHHQNKQTGLRWQYTLSRCELKVALKGGIKFSLDVSLLQASVLLLFNDQKGQFSIKEITSFFAN